MSDLEKLRACCRAVVQRQQNNATLDFPCVICQQVIRGQHGSMEHYRVNHGICTSHFDDVADLNGFLSHLRSLLLPAGDTKFHCPVCGVSCDGEASLVAHAGQLGHTFWDARAIPTLAPFCITAVSSGNDELQHEEDDEVTGKVIDQAFYDEDEDEDEDEEWEEEPAMCLLCDTTSHNCLLHMKEAHSFDFVAAVQQHEGVNDVYDVIRIVNIIRGCVADGTCPHHYGEDSPEAESCRHVIASSSLLSHLRYEPLHALPRAIPTGDKELIPRLVGDTFISSIVVGGNIKFGETKCQTGGDEGEDYPMVPTMMELAAKRLAKGGA
ncbi:C2H2 type zinc-finger (2 copies) [Trypanosoma brucei equiperdum]|uniref:C2H2 type zinc-finger (2 copies) n=1 Tax=Trypanosoma brucei equiperdum TaxID=630700 RepID=A0A3L6L642_9TRYP|nr:C2H2 type zinc-finger (2 copies) [Trypanosoma brucei equiperdum]